MYKYDDPSATMLGEFTDGEPLNGIPPTVLKSVWLNMVQRELLSLVHGAGLNPNKESENQVLQAVAKLDGDILEAAKAYAEQLVLGAMQVEIVQEPGDGENVVMSQRAVSEALLGTAAADHGHAIADIEGLESALSAKAAKVATNTTFGGVKISFSNGVLNIRTDSQEA